MAAIPKETAQIDATFTSKPNPPGGVPGTRTGAGLYYGTNKNPRIYGDTLASLTGTPATNADTYTHTISLYDLVPNNKYYAQGYATNGTGTYFSDPTPITLNNVEATQINSQIWTSRNCNVSRYSDGTPIPEVQSSQEWAGRTEGAWCYYSHSTANGITYGKLYNWYAVMGIHDGPSLTNTSLRKSLAPKGWRVPTTAEFTTLINYSGGTGIAGRRLKSQEIWTSGVSSPDLNILFFSALPGGFRDFDGTFGGIGSSASWWTSSELNQTEAWYNYVNTQNSTQPDTSFKTVGYSVRFISDEFATFGTKFWFTKNLDVSTYADGTEIPEVQDPAQWASRTTGAWCYYDAIYGNDKIYGKLYNWYAVNNTANGGLAPYGYHIATDAEWTTLTNAYNLKTSAFKGRPGGYLRSPTNNFDSIGSRGYWWSTTAVDTTSAYGRVLTDSTGATAKSGYPKTAGLSVRVIADNYFEWWSNGNGFYIDGGRPGPTIDLRGTMVIMGDPITFRALAYMNGNEQPGTTFVSSYVNGISRNVENPFYNTDGTVYSPPFTLSAGVYDFAVDVTFVLDGSFGAAGGLEYVYGNFPA